MKNIIKAGFAFSVIAALVAATLISAARTGLAAQDNKMMGAAAQDKSLYERLGGAAAISAVIDDFVGRVAADSRINQKFAKSNIDRVKIELKSFVCQATGGPCKYMGNSMPKAHKNMKVTEGEFNALVEDLVATLDKFNVPAKEKGELLGALGPLKSQIVEVNSDATGTPLPSDFKPAPALSDKQKKEASSMGGDKSKSKM
jgi:hemoglobin